MTTPKIADLAVTGAQLATDSVDAMIEASKEALKDEPKAISPATPDVEPIADEITFDDVLMIGGDIPAIGAPTVEGATVSALIQAQDRAKKVLVFKKKRRKQYRRTNGHRQDLLRVRIGDIHV